MSELSENELYTLIGRVSELFYEKVYEDPWFKKLFRNIKQEIITSQQTDFMVAAFGGPKRFNGRNPKEAHPHIFVDEEIWAHREKLLLEALKELKAPDPVVEKWLKIDEAFKSGIMKGSYADCEKRYTNDQIIYEPKKLNKIAS